MIVLAPVDVCPASGEGFENELIAGKYRERKKWMTTHPSDHMVEVQALREAMIPTLAILTVCCSMAS